MTFQHANSVPQYGNSANSETTFQHANFIPQYGNPAIPGTAFQHANSVPQCAQCGNSAIPGIAFQHASPIPQCGNPANPGIAFQHANSIPEYGNIPYPAMAFQPQYGTIYSNYTFYNGAPQQYGSPNGTPQPYSQRTSLPMHSKPWPPINSIKKEDPISQEKLQDVQAKNRSILDTNPKLLRSTKADRSTSPLERKSKENTETDLVKKGQELLKRSPREQVTISGVSISPESLQAFREFYTGHNFELLRATASMCASVSVVLEADRPKPNLFSREVEHIFFVKYQALGSPFGHWVVVRARLSDSLLFYIDSRGGTDLNDIWCCQTIQEVKHFLQQCNVSKNFQTLSQAPAYRQTDYTSCGPLSWHQVDFCITPDLQCPNPDAMRRRQLLQVLNALSQIRVEKKPVTVHEHDEAKRRVLEVVDSPVSRKKARTEAYTSEEHHSNASSETDTVEGRASPDSLSSRSHYTPSLLDSIRPSDTDQDLGKIPEVLTDSVILKNDRIPVES